MLEKAELIIKVKNNRIIVLERCIKDLGGKIPPEDEKAPIDKVKSPSPQKW